MGYLPTKESLELAVYRTRAVDITVREEKIYKRRISKNDDGTISDTTGAWLAAAVMSMERSFFVSATRYIGLGPADTQDGDVICIVLGSEVPFLLRPADGGRYTFVGECYVHGCMDGEAFDGLRERVGEGPLTDHFCEFKID
jgi:hypothetical protein